MSDPPSPKDVVFVERALDGEELRRLVAAHFEDMVKYVVDVARGKVREITFALIGRGEPLP